MFYFSVLCPPPRKFTHKKHNHNIRVNDKMLYYRNILKIPGFATNDASYSTLTTYSFFPYFCIMYLEFLSLASGSSGNCYYLGNSHAGILIDAGLCVRKMRKRLKDAGIELSNVVGVFITHDHVDHARNAAVLSEKYNIPVYTTELIHTGIEQSYLIRDKIYTSKRIIEKDVPFKLFDFTITAFDVPHDGFDNVGYHISHNDIQIVFVTDLGHIPDSAAEYLRLADYLILEANYDREMLETGPYHYLLKKRISGTNGHLCNDQAADFLAENHSSHLKHVFLCHLSRENNRPDLAYETVRARLARENIVVGQDLQLTVLRRTAPTGVYVFE